MALAMDIDAAAKGDDSFGSAFGDTVFGAVNLGGLSGLFSSSPSSSIAPSIASDGGLHVPPLFIYGAVGFLLLVLVMKKKKR